MDTVAAISWRSRRADGASNQLPGFDQFRFREMAEIAHFGKPMRFCGAKPFLVLKPVSSHIANEVLHSSLLWTQCPE
jgi:hypothetical protein